MTGQKDGHFKPLNQQEKTSRHPLLYPLCIWMPMDDWMREMANKINGIGIWDARVVLIRFAGAPFENAGVHGGLLTANCRRKSSAAPARVACLRPHSGTASHTNSVSCRATEKTWPGRRSRPCAATRHEQRSRARNSNPASWRARGAPVRG